MKSLIVIAVFFLFFSCKSYRDFTKERNERKDLIARTMRKPEKLKVVSQKQAKEKDYNFFANTKGDSMIVVCCFFKEKSVKKIILWDNDAPIRILSNNGGAFYFLAEKKEYLLRCSTFKGRKKEKFTSFIAVKVGAPTKNFIKTKNPVVDKIIAGDLEIYEDLKPTIKFSRQGFGSDVFIKLCDKGDNAGLNSFSLNERNRSNSYDLKGVNKIKRPASGYYPFSVSVTDIAGQTSTKKYRPSNSPYSAIGSFMPIYDLGYCFHSFKITNPFRNREAYKNSFFLPYQSYGGTWRKYLKADGAQIEFSFQAHKTFENYFVFKKGFEADLLIFSLGNLWGSDNLGSKLTVGLGISSSDNSFGFSNFIENTEEPLFRDQENSAFYEGSVSLKDSFFYKEFNFPLTIGLSSKVDKWLTIGFDLRPSLSFTRGVTLAYGKNSGLEGKYYGDKKIIEFSGNEIEYAEVSEISQGRLSLNVNTFAKIKIFDFFVEPKISYQSAKLGSEKYYLKENSVIFSCSLSYRFWW